MLASGEFEYKNRSAMGETIRDQLSQRAQEQDYGSMMVRLSNIFGEKAAFKVMNKPLDMLGGQTPAEVLQGGSDEDRYELERFVTFGETPPWYLQSPEAQRE